MTFDLVALVGIAIAAFAVGIAAAILWFAAAEKRQTAEELLQPQPKPVVVNIDANLLVSVAHAAGFKLVPIQTHQHSSTVQ